MKFVYIGAAIVVFAALRLWMASRRRQRSSESRHAASAQTETARVVESSTDVQAEGPRAEDSDEPMTPPRWVSWLAAALGDVGLVARREIRERVRGRIFRVGTLVILLGVGSCHRHPEDPQQRAPLHRRQVGVVGAGHSGDHRGGQVQRQAGRDSCPDRAAANCRRRRGRPAIRERSTSPSSTATSIVVNGSLSGNSASTTSSLVQVLAPDLGVLHAYQAAGSHARSDRTGGTSQAGTRPEPPSRLHQRGDQRRTSVIGVILIFLMLTQYNTWILIGVMQEKSSRVVEVLLATVRPIQLLGGKVLGHRPGRPGPGRPHRRSSPSC